MAWPRANDGSRGNQGVTRDEQVNVTVETLDDVLANETKGLYLLKIDAQGHEYSILRGAANYIRRRPAGLISFAYRL